MKPSKDKIDELRYDLYSKPLEEYDGVLESLYAKQCEVIRKVNELSDKLESQSQEHKCQHGMGMGSYCIQCGGTVFFVKNETPTNNVAKDTSPKKECEHKFIIDDSVEAHGEECIKCNEVRIVGKKVIHTSEGDAVGEVK